MLSGNMNWNAINSNQTNLVIITHKLGDAMRGKNKEKKKIDRDINTSFPQNDNVGSNHYNAKFLENLWKYLGKHLWSSFLSIHNKSTMIFLDVSYLKSYLRNKFPICKIINTASWHHDPNFKEKTFNSLPIIRSYKKNCVIYKPIDYS